jgi:hypothetical protein
MDSAEYFHPNKSQAQIGAGCAKTRTPNLDYWAADPHTCRCSSVELAPQAQRSSAQKLVRDRLFEQPKGLPEWALQL